MEERPFHKLKIGYNGKIHKALRENLRYLEPKGASKRILFQVPHTYDKAIKEIHTSQEKFNFEREKIRSLLNTPIKSTKDHQNISQIQAQKSRKVFKSKSSLNLIRKSKLSIKRNENSQKLLNNSSENVVKINMLISSCEKVNQSNKLLIKQCKNSKKDLNNKGKKIGKIIESISSSEFYKFEKQRQKIESEIFKV